MKYINTYVFSSLNGVPIVYGVFSSNLNLDALVKEYLVQKHQALLFTLLNNVNNNFKIASRVSLDKKRYF